MTPGNGRPVFFFYGLLTIFSLLLIFRLFYLEVLQTGKYRQLATLNHVRIIPEPAPRGEILDRNNLVLAASRPVFSAILYPTGNETPELIERLAAILQIPAAEISQSIKDGSSGGLFFPVTLKKRLEFDEMRRLEEEKFRIPGLIIQRTAARFYPGGRNLAHVLGYVGMVSPEEQIKLQDEKKNIPYGPHDYIGKAGMEMLYEEQLRGINGGQQVAVDSGGRPIEVLESIPPAAGENLVLTIDSEMQAVAEKSMGDKRGAVVVLDTLTGEVLTLVSHPDYDPNMFSQPIKPAFWLAQKKMGYPFFNRALNGYPPGSVFKLITAMAAMEAGKLRTSDTFYCPGFLKLGVRTAWCWQKKGHGMLSLLEAIKQSCDVTFYTIGLRVGVEKIGELARKFSFGAKTGIEFPWEGSGTVPSAEWKKKTYHEGWYPGDTINLAIGQGFIQTTPLQVAIFMEALANDGTYYYPRLIKKSVRLENENKKHKKNSQEDARILGQVEISPDILKFIKESMRQVVSSGTGQAALLKNVEIAGKTGTAEDPPRIAPHAWFACFAPFNQPRLALVIFVEQGGHGGTVAAPIARDIIDWWYTNRANGGASKTVADPAPPEKVKG